MYTHTHSLSLVVDKVLSTMAEETKCDPDAESLADNLSTLAIGPESPHSSSSMPPLDVIPEGPVGAEEVSSTPPNECGLVIDYDDEAGIEFLKRMIKEEELKGVTGVCAFFSGTVVFTTAQPSLTRRGPMLEMSSIKRKMAALVSDASLKVAAEGMGIESQFLSLTQNMTDTWGTPGRATDGGAFKAFFKDKEIDPDVGKAFNAIVPATAEALGVLEKLRDTTLRRASGYAMGMLSDDAQLLLKESTVVATSGGLALVMLPGASVGVFVRSQDLGLLNDDDIIQWAHTCIARDVTFPVQTLCQTLAPEEQP